MIFSIAGVSGGRIGACQADDNQDAGSNSGRNCENSEEDALFCYLECFDVVDEPNGKKGKSTKGSRKASSKAGKSLLHSGSGSWSSLTGLITY